MVVTNIFRPRNDWNVRSMNCKKPVSKNDFIKNIADIITKELDVSPFADLEYNGRLNVQARQLLITMLYNYTSKTLDNIGKVLCKDHATVLHSIKSINNQYDTDKRFRAMYDRINLKVKELKFK